MKLTVTVSVLALITIAYATVAIRKVRALPRTQPPQLLRTPEYRETQSLYRPDGWI